MNIPEFLVIFPDFLFHFTMSIYIFSTSFLQIFCIFLNEEASYKYNSGRFRKPWHWGTFLVFSSFFGLFPYMVTWKSIHIQKKPVADFIFIKFCGIFYFYNFWGLWEYFTYSKQLLPNWVHHKSNFKQEKLIFECVFINSNWIYNFYWPWEFFRPWGWPYFNIVTP